MSTDPHATRVTFEPKTLIPRLLKGFRLRGASPKDLEAFTAAAARPLQEPAEPLPALPKISCLMVSRNRLPLVARSVRSYVDQTYPNKELVIVRDPSAPSGDVAAHLTSLGRRDIQLICPTGSRSLSALRNVSLEHATGEVMCQWDDDDLVHPARLRVQLAAMQETNAAAAYLQDDLHYFVRTGEMYWVRWGESLLRCLPGTAMFRRSMAQPYSDDPLYSAKSEDTLFMMSLGCRTTFLGGMPYLYVYTFHDNNTWSEAHRRALVKQMFADSSARESVFIDELHKLGLNVAGRACPEGRALHVESGGPVVA